jgi:hypothetical protein
MELDIKAYWLADRPSVTMWLWLWLEQFQFLSDSDKAESPGGFSSWEYKDENGVWIVKINWEQTGTRSTEEYKRSAYEECKVWLEDLCVIFVVKWSDSFYVEVCC